MNKNQFKYGSCNNVRVDSEKVFLPTKIGQMCRDRRHRMEKMMTEQNHQSHRQPVHKPVAAKAQGPTLRTPQHRAPKPQAAKPRVPSPQTFKPQAPKPQGLQPHLYRVQPPKLQSPQYSAPKVPVTREDVKRIQRATAADNDGRQADWTARQQSVADRRDAQASPAAKPGGAGQRGGKGSSVKKAA